MNTTPELSTTFTTPSDTELVASRVFDAPPELVWKMLTEPEHVQQWLTGPDGWIMPICEMDVRPGGAWRYGWSREDGSDPFEMYGTFEEVDPPHRFTNTETMDPYPPSRNEQVLTETEDGKTLLTATVTYVSAEAMQGALATGMKDGWSKSYDRLDEYMAA